MTLDAGTQRGLERNLVLVDLYFAAQNALFWLPVFVLWFSGSLSASGVLLLESVYYTSVVVLEVPSGWMSDRLGRRATLVMSGLGWAGGAAVIGMSSGFAGFAVGQVLLAAGRAFASGTDSSLLYESLDALGRPLEMRARHGRAAAWGFGTFAVASLAGGALGWVDLRLPYVASVLGGLVAAGTALAFTEPPATGAELTPREQLGVVRQASADPVLRKILVLAVLVVTFLHIPYELQQPWLEAGLGESRAAVASGAFVAVAFGLAAFASRMAAPLAQWLDPEETGLGYTRGSALAMGGLAAVMGAMAVGPYAWIAPVLAFRSVPSGLLGPLTDAEVHPRLPSSIRATWLSLQSLAGRLLFAAVLVVLAWGVGEDWSFEALRRVLVPSAGAAVVGALLALWMGRLR
ncbi:MAG: MFS transporter [Myxococcota bacterium]